MGSSQPVIRTIDVPLVHPVKAAPLRLAPVDPERIVVPVPVRQPERVPVRRG